MKPSNAASATCAEEARTPPARGGPPRALARLTAFLALLAAPAVAGGAATGSIDYLYLHANEGGSSGGHVALRLGDAVFDFQHEHGLLRLDRSESAAFQYRYRSLQNRPIELSRVPVSPGTFERLTQTFERRQLVQAQQLARLAEIRRDALLLDAWSARASGPPPSFPVEGAGFFGRSASGASSAWLPGLRARIEAAQGPDFVASRRIEVEGQLAALELRPTPAIRLDPLQVPDLPPGFSRRYGDALAALAALDVLGGGFELRDGALAGGAPLALGEGEVQRLRRASSALGADMARLAASPRPDWGSALLLGMARLAALERSIASKRLVLLDAFPAAAERVPITAKRRRWLPALEAESLAELARAREAFFRSEGWQEFRWSALEEAANRWLELARAREGAPEIRVSAGRLVPEALATPERLPLPDAGREELAALRAGIGEVEGHYRRELARLYGYDLIRRNCVSELLATLEQALGDGFEAQLGPRIERSTPLAFIPFVSARSVREEWPVSEQRELPSHRAWQLARLAERESPLWIALRESNVWTSTIYRGSDTDGVFVFFTEDAPVLRPVLGAFNLTAGLAWAGVGALAAPLDRGRSLRAGLWGAFWSLPELFFQNVRKGSSEYVPPDERPPAA